MKKLFKYLLIVIALMTMTISLPSCGNDDEPEETTSTGKADVDDNRIYGTWEAHSSVMTLC